MKLRTLVGIPLALAFAACGSTSSDCPRARAGGMSEAESSGEHAQHAVDTPTTCVAVHLGLDLRVLPQPASPQVIDTFVAAQADELVAASHDAHPRVELTQGTGTMTAVFSGSDERAAMVACDRAVAAYLERAPRLPITMEPAASVLIGCHFCER